MNRGHNSKTVERDLTLKITYLHFMGFKFYLDGLNTVISLEKFETKCFSIFISI